MENIQDLLDRVAEDFISYNAKKKFKTSITYTRNYNEFEEKKEIELFYNELKNKRLLQGYNHYELFQTDNDFSLELFSK